MAGLVCAGWRVGGRQIQRDLAGVRGVVLRMVTGVRHLRRVEEHAEGRDGGGKGDGGEVDKTAMGRQSMHTLTSMPGTRSYSHVGTMLPVAGLVSSTLCSSTTFPRRWTQG